MSPDILSMFLSGIQGFCGSMISQLSNGNSLERLANEFNNLKLNRAMKNVPATFGNRTRI